MISRYTAGKCAALMAYYSLIDYLGLGLTYKFVTFHISTPIVKYFHFNRLMTANDRRHYAVSIIHDFAFSTIWFGIFIPKLVGPLFWTFPITNAVALVAFEIVQHRTQYKNTDYEIMTSSNPLDYCLSLLFSVLFYLMSLYIDFDQPPNSISFPVFLVIVFVLDVVFGLLHYATHVVPFLYKKHMVHHQYKKEKLNAFANFYSEFLDAVLMNAGFFPSALFMCWLGRDYVPFMELTLLAGSTHSRYTDKQMNLMYFFEWDLIDIAFGAPRMASYHAHHHHALTEHFSAFGFISDDTIRSLFSNTMLQKKLRAE